MAAIIRVFVGRLEQLLDHLYPGALKYKGSAGTVTTLGLA